MHQNLNTKDNRGFTILEILIAALILATAITASYSVFSGIITATSTISLRLTASYLAQEGVEIIRNIRDTKWLSTDCEDDPVNCWENIVVSYFNICSSSGCEADYTTGAADEITILRPYTATPLNMDNNNFYSYSGESATRFKRKITVTSPGTDVLLVSAEVFWDDRGKSYSFTAEEYLYNWY